MTSGLVETQIKKVIKEGIENPDGDSDLRKQQLRELALLNGTLREGDPLQLVEYTKYVHFYFFENFMLKCSSQ